MVNEVYNLGKTTSFNINLEIDDASSFGKQINYFRKLKNIRAKDMAKALNIGYSTILRIENDNFNRKLNHQSIIILNKIIDYMDIRDKLNDKSLLSIFKYNIRVKRKRSYYCVKR